MFYILVRGYVVLALGLLEGDFRFRFIVHVDANSSYI